MFQSGISVALCTAEQTMLGAHRSDQPLMSLLTDLLLQCLTQLQSIPAHLSSLFTIESPSSYTSLNIRHPMAFLGVRIVR